MASKITAVESVMSRGRWHFATPSILHPGRLNLSLHTWASRKTALEAGRREYRVSK